MKRIINWLNLLLKSQTHREFISYIATLLGQINPEDIYIYLNKEYFSREFISDVERRIVQCGCKEKFMNTELFHTEVYMFFSMNDHRKDLKETMNKTLAYEFKEQFGLHEK